MSPYSDRLDKQMAEISEAMLCDRILERRINEQKYQRQNVGQKPSKYHVLLKGLWVDVYDVLHAFSVTNPGDQHAIKKMLLPGKRGHKDGIQDRREAIASLERAIQLEGDNV